MVYNRYDIIAQKGVISMRKFFKRILSVCLCLITMSLFLTACKDDPPAPPEPEKPPAPVTFTFADNSAPVIYMDTNEPHQVARAMDDFIGDIEAVTGKRSALVSVMGALGKTPVIVGTLDNSELISGLVRDKKLSVDDIAGEWEAFKISIVEKPFDGVEKALVVVGSDARGAIYGMYEISELIGVSPWYFWGDVPIEPQSKIVFAKEEIERVKKPDVMYRGMFINDEANLWEWSHSMKTPTDGEGNIYPNTATYEKVFELILRLKANTLWPAMHNQSAAFNKVINPETGISFNAEAADRYGVIMGASHCEMLLRNNETEWVPWCEDPANQTLLKVKNPSNWKSVYDYSLNPEAMNAYWEERVAQNYKFENIYTIGLRAVHDSDVPCQGLTDKSDRGKSGLIKQAIAAQLEILEKYEALYEQEFGVAKKFAKVFCPYKEIGDYFNRFDLGVPSDAILLWADDNHGYVRQHSTASQLEKYAGAGVYYHSASYYDIMRERSYLWMATTPMSLVYEEMSKAYNSGSDDCWIINVGDIKPSEINMDYFFRLAFDIDSYNFETNKQFYAGIFTRDFRLDKETADEFADIITQFYQVAIAKRPEFHGINKGGEYSLVDFGDEAQLQIEKLIALENRSQAIWEMLGENYRDAYYQRVHYMIKSTRLTFEKSIYQQKNALYLKQGRYASVNLYADASLNAYENILQELQYYNKTMSNGKWDGIMNPYQGVNNLPQIVGKPSVSKVSSSSAQAAVGAVSEGQTSISEKKTLYFNALSDDVRFIDVFSRGANSQSFIMTAPDYVHFFMGDEEVVSGVLGGKRTVTDAVVTDKRFNIKIDWDMVAVGETSGVITVAGSSLNTDFAFKAVKPAVDASSEKVNGYYETNGIVSIEAELYSANVAVGGKEWKLAQDLGRSGSSMKAYPDHKTMRIDTDFENKSPYLEYSIYFENLGEYDGVFYRIPTLNEGNADADEQENHDPANPGKTNRTAMQFNDGDPFLLRGNSYSPVDQGNPETAWSLSVLRHIEKMNFKIAVTKKGWNTIRIYMSDGGIAFDKMVLRASFATPDSYLGAPVSYNTIAGDYTANMPARLPSFITN